MFWRLYPGVDAFETLLLVTLSACWKASRPDMLVERISPIRCASEDACHRVYRPCTRGLECRFQGCELRTDAPGNGADLARVVRVGCVAALLQGGRESMHIAAGVEGGGVARTVAKERNVVLKALRP